MSTTARVKATFRRFFKRSSDKKKDKRAEGVEQIGNAQIAKDSPARRLRW